MPNVLFLTSDLSLQCANAVPINFGNACGDDCGDGSGFGFGHPWTYVSATATAMMVPQCDLCVCHTLSTVWAV